MSNTSSLYISFQAFQRKSLLMFRRLGERTAATFILEKLVWVLAQVFDRTISAKAKPIHSPCRRRIFNHSAMQKPKNNHHLQSSNSNFHITSWLIQIRHWFHHKYFTSFLHCSRSKLHVALHLVPGVNFT